MLTPELVTEVRWEIENRYEILFSNGVIGEILRHVARKHPVNLVVDYLTNLTWDGVPRVDSMLTRAFKVEASQLTRAYSRRYCIAAVARAMEPGCKVDSVLLLVGAEGLGKSTALKVLAGEAFFTDSRINVRSRDSFLVLRRTWFYEVAEGVAFQDVRSDEVKQFLSSSHDAYRAAYGRVVSSTPRQCVLAVTTNNERPLRDPTGSRRFWPVRVGGRVDLTWLRQNRDQIWAEAVAAYRSSEQWYLTEEEEELRAKDAASFENIAAQGGRVFGATIADGGQSGGRILAGIQRQGGRLASAVSKLWQGGSVSRSSADGRRGIRFSLLSLQIGGK